MSVALSALLVVVPARNEARRIGRCVAALDHATEVLRRAGWTSPVLVAVVLDSCTDATAAVLRARSSPTAARWATFPVEDAGPGVARDHGIRALSALLASGVPTTQVWVATTDADSRVPPNWLTHQVAVAAQGWDAWAGTVEPDPEASAAHRAGWHRRHHLASGHEHVFGASLGIRLSAYQAVGGFPAVAVGEDVQLINGLTKAGHRVRADDEARVLTSGRLLARAVGGFGDYLRQLPPTPPSDSGPLASSAQPSLRP